MAWGGVGLPATNVVDVGGLMLLRGTLCLRRGALGAGSPRM